MTLLVGIYIDTISVEGRYPLGQSLKLFTNPSLSLSLYKYYSLEVKYGFMIYFSQGNVSKSDILYLLGRSFKSQSAICYVLFHLLSFLPPYHQDWQCSRSRLHHLPGLQRKYNLKQNLRTCRMTSSMSKTNLCCFKPLQMEGKLAIFIKIQMHIPSDTHTHMQNCIM